MNQDSLVKAVQALVMFLTSTGIMVTTDEEARGLAVTIAAGAFGLLSILSAVKAWMSRAIKPSAKEIAEVALLDRQIATEIAKEKAYLKKAGE